MPLKRALVIASAWMCAAAVLLWLTSMFASFSHRFAWGDASKHTLDACFCADGIVVASCLNDPSDAAPDLGYWHAIVAHTVGPHYFFLGAGMLLRPGHHIFILPLWTLIAATLVAPAGSVWRNRRQSHPRFNLCARCRYDLRAHHAGQHCPECGTLIDQSPRNKSPQHASI